MTTDPPKLLDRVRAEIRLRHYSRRTEEAYVHWIRCYIVFHGKRHPRDLGAADVTAFLTWLAVEKHVAAATQNQAFSALLFLYERVLRQDLGVVEHAAHAKRPIHHVPVVSVDEERRVLKELNGVVWLIASLLSSTAVVWVSRVRSIGCRDVQWTAFCATVSHVFAVGRCGVIGN